ncbi:MAG: FMN-binding protein [Clostridia bacterium]|nr:FMN-binding protein [Clostridia bacterium]
MKNSVKSVVVLFAICLVISAVLAAVNFITEPVIEESDRQAAQAALKIVMPYADEFNEIDISQFGFDKAVTNVITNIYAANSSGKNIGFVFRMSVTGYSTGLVIMCGIDDMGSVTGTKYLAGGETLGYEKTYGEVFLGRTSVEGVDTITGATLTTRAYKNAIATALEAFSKISAAEQGGN